MAHVGADGSVGSSALQAIEDYDHASQHLYGDMALYQGQIVQVYAIDDPRNQVDGSPGKFTLFDVLINTPEGGTQTIKRCKALQPLFGGAFNNFLEVLPTDPGPKNNALDSFLKRGSRVLVGMICGQKSAGVILGTMPHDNGVAVAKRPSRSNGTYLDMEFQGLNVSISNDGALKIVFNSPRDDSGSPTNAGAAPTTMEIDSSGNVKVATNASQELSIDRVAKTIKLTNGGTTILMDANSTLVQTDAKDVKINASAACKINTGANTEITAGGKVKLDASQIELNGSAGQVLTTLTDPIVDYIYGAPTEGVPTVKAG